MRLLDNARVPHIEPGNNSGNLDSETLRQFTSQSEVSDLTTARRLLESATHALNTAHRWRNIARRWVMLHRCRLQFAQLGIPSWVIALAMASLSAVIIAMFLITILDVTLPMLVTSIPIVYIFVGAPIFWLLRDYTGETDANRSDVRAHNLRMALDRLSAAKDDLHQRQLQVQRLQIISAGIEQALRSKEHLRRVAADRLLSIEPDRLHPDEFERYIADVFAFLGYDCKCTGTSGDQGVDVIACKGHVRIAIQAKRYIGSVSNTAIQEVYAGMAHHRCHRCLVITTGTFTSGARSLAESTGCMLISLDQIPQLIRGELGF